MIQKGLKHCGLSKPEEIDVPGRKGTFTCAYVVRYRVLAY